MPRRDDVRSVGKPRSRRIRQDHSPSTRRRHQLHRHGRRLLARRIGGDRRQGAQGPPRPDRARDQGARSDGRRPERARQLAPLDHPGVRGQPSPSWHRLDRPLPGPSIRRRHRPRRDTRRAHGSRSGRQGPLHRLVHLPGERDRDGAMGRRTAELCTVRLRAAAVLATRSRRRVRGAAAVRATRHGCDSMEPARGRLAERPLAQGPGAAGEHAVRADPAALRPVAAREPAEARCRRGLRRARRESPTSP